MTEQGTSYPPATGSGAQPYSSSPQHSALDLSTLESALPPSSAYPQHQQPNVASQPYPPPQTFATSSTSTARASGSSPFSATFIPNSASIDRGEFNAPHYHTDYQAVGSIRHEDEIYPSKISTFQPEPNPGRRTKRVTIDYDRKKGNPIEKDIDYISDGEDFPKPQRNKAKLLVGDRKNKDKVTLYESRNGQWYKANS